ncbi:MAG: hypothetical protein WC178_01275 [Candidatus Paceibacterota bacterium]
MITKAQFNSALVDLEKRIENKTDIKINSLKKEIENGEKNFAGKNEVFQRVEKVFISTSKDFETIKKEIENLRIRISQLESRVAEHISNESSVPEGEIKDDLND